MPSKTNECRMCGYQDDSRIQIREHVMGEHSLNERLHELVDRVMREETNDIKK